MQPYQKVIAESMEAQAALMDEWALGDYENGDTGCPHCGRMRLCKCPNGKHRCEKCNWSPELNGFAPSSE